jgi:elongator complex protein 6
LDLDGLNKAGKFSFVDGLTGLLSGGQGSESTGDRGRILKSGKLDDIKKGIEAAIGDVRLGSKVLIVDQLDELLAISGEEDVTGLALEGMLLSLREVSPH